jgi:hypothetical protein
MSGQFEPEQTSHYFPNTPDCRVGIRHGEVDAVRPVEVAVAKVETQQPEQIV